MSDSTVNRISLKLIFHELCAHRLPNPNPNPASPDTSTCSVYFSASIDDQGRLSDRLLADPNPAQIRFIRDEGRPAPELHWEMDTKVLRRLRAHAPRLRISIVRTADEGAMEHGIGFAQIDLRQIKQGANLSKEWITVHGEGVDQGRLLVTFSLVAVEKNTQSSAGMSAKSLIISAAFAEDRIVIGTQATDNFMLSLTLRAASFLEKLSHVPQGCSFWMEYHMFGIKICTDRFPTLRSAKFPPIRDSFKLKASASELQAFLCNAPIAVLLLAAADVNSRRKSKIRPSTQRVQTLGIATVDFGPLFDQGDGCKGELPNVLSVCSAVPLEHSTLADGSDSDGSKNRGAQGNAPAVSIEIRLEKETCEQTQGPETSQAKPTVEAAEEDETNGNLDNQNEMANSQPPEPPTVPQEQQTDSTSNPPLSSTLEVAAQESEDASRKEANPGQIPTVGIEVASVTSTPMVSKPPREPVHLVATLENFEGPACDLYVDSQGHRRSAIKQDVQDAPLRYLFDVDSTEAFTLLCISKEDPSAVLAEAAFANNLCAELTQSKSKMVESPLRDLTKSPAESHCGSIRITLAGEQDELRGEEGRQKAGLFTARVRLMAVESADLTEKDVFVQYAYRLFGIDHSDPVRTKPCVRINRMDYRKLPHGDHEFEFNAAEAELADVAKNEPIVFQLCEKKGVVLGEAKLFLQQLLLAKPEYRYRGRMFATLEALDTFRKSTATKAPNIAAALQEKPELLRSVRTRLDVFSSGNSLKLATLHVSVHLVDTGKAAINPTALLSTPPKSAIKSLTKLSSRKSSIASKKTVRPPPEDSYLEEIKEVEARRMQLLKEEQRLEQSFAELERWRQMVEHEVVELEKKRLAELEAEWARQEYERVRSVEDAKLELAELQSRARSALTDAEKRERQVRRLEQDLRRAAELKVQETELVCRRLREEFDHKKKLQREQISALEKRLKRALEGNTALHKRCQKVEEEFAAFRENARKTPEAALLQQIATLKGEKKELQARLEAEQRKCELEQVKSDSLHQQLSAMSRRLSAQQRVENLALASNVGIKRVQQKREEDYARLRSIRNELRLLQVDTVRQESPSEDAARLVQERRKIMSTGLYSEDDPLVREIDKKIQEAAR